MATRLDNNVDSIFRVCALSGDPLRIISEIFILCPTFMVHSPPPVYSRHPNLHSRELYHRLGSCSLHKLLNCMIAWCSCVVSFDSCHGDGGVAVYVRGDGGDTSISLPISFTLRVKTIEVNSIFGTHDAATCSLVHSRCSYIRTRTLHFPAHG